MIMNNGRSRIEFDMASADDALLAKQLVDAAQMAKEQNRMTFVMSGTETVAAIVPVDVAVALEPNVYRLAGDSVWTELPATGMFCARGDKITQINWTDEADGHPVGHHADGSVCDHTAHPDLG